MKPSAREGLTEDELELFDLLEEGFNDAGRDARAGEVGCEAIAETSSTSTRRCWLQDWFKDKSRFQKQVRSEIERVLDEGLAGNVRGVLFSVVRQHVFRSRGGLRQPRTQNGLRDLSVSARSG